MTRKLKNEHQQSGGVDRKLEAADWAEGDKSGAVLFFMGLGNR